MSSKNDTTSICSSSNQNNSNIYHSQRNVRQHIQEPDLFSLSSLNPDHNISTKYNTITIDELMGDNPRQKRTFIRLQLLRIVSGLNDGGNRGQSNFTFYNRSRQDKSTNTSYSQMFLFREIDSTIRQVVHMIEGRSLNKRLWVRNHQFRVNEMISIGMCIALLCPAPIPNQLENEVPILKC